MQPSFFCDDGFNIHLGEGASLNTDCAVLDVAPVRIGAVAQVGPAMQNHAADHPRPERRWRGLDPGRPVSIAANAWAGAGAVGTRDVPAGARVAGNPARLLPG